jgi:hypothetical protein
MPRNEPEWTIEEQEENIRLAKKPIAADPASMTRAGFIEILGVYIDDLTMITQRRYVSDAVFKANVNVNVSRRDVKKVIENCKIVLNNLKKLDSDLEKEFKDKVIETDMILGTDYLRDAWLFKKQACYLLRFAWYETSFESLDSPLEHARGNTDWPEDQYPPFMRFG